MRENNRILTILMSHFRVTYNCFFLSCHTSILFIIIIVFSNTIMISHIIMIIDTSITMPIVIACHNHLLLLFPIHMITGAQTQIPNITDNIKQIFRLSILFIKYITFCHTWQDK